MATRKVKDAIDLTTEEKIYFRGHAKATYMSDGRNVEDAINQIGTGGGGGGITAETDPIFSASAAASITEEKKAEWDNKMDKLTLATVATTGSYNDLIDKPASTQYFGPILEGDLREDIVWNQDTGKATIDLRETGFTHIVYPILTQTYDVFYKVASLEELRANPQLYLDANAKGYYGSVHYSESEGIATLTLVGTTSIYNYPWKAVLFNNGVVTLSEALIPESVVKKSDLGEYVKHTELGDFEAEVVDPKLAQKQDKLVSGTNIKTINGESILGSGDLQIEGGGGNGLANYPIEYPFTDGVVELVPNTYYMVEPQLGQTEIAFSLAEPTDNTIVNEYVVQIDNKYMIGDVMISFPSNITWKNGDIPTLKEGKILVISIVESLAVYAEF